MYDVITIGTASRDVFVQSAAFKIVRDPRHLEKIGFVTGEAQCLPAGGKIDLTDIVLTVGGGAANAGVTFARQGLSAGAFFKIGRDHNGQAVVEDLKNENVTPHPLWDKKRGTAYSILLLSPTGERTILVYRGASEDVTRQEIVRLPLTARWAYIAPGSIPFNILATIVKKLVRHQVRVAINPSAHYLKYGLPRLRPVLCHASVIILNREEAAGLTGVSYRDEKGIFRKFDEITDGLAVMTDGPRGVLVADGKHLYRAGVYREKRIADRTGAGDAFGSGFVSALAKTARFTPADIVRAIRVGSANATAVVEHIGAQAGILRKDEFAHQARWRKLAVALHALR